MSLFKRALPKKRITPSGKELRSAQGSIEVKHDFAETTYVSGHNGLRDSNVRGERHIAEDNGEMRFGEMADAPGSKIRVTPEMKNLVAMLANHVEPAGDFTYNEDQMRGLRSFFSDKKNQNAANELQKLRSLDMAPTAKQRTRRMELETKVAAMKTAMTRLLRAA